MQVQSLGSLLPTTVTEFALQREHVVCPFSSLNFPASHAIHGPDPFMALYVPALHSMQASFASSKYPGRHVHCRAPSNMTRTLGQEQTQSLVPQISAEHNHPCSIKHELEHPSPVTVLPSSQPSPYENTPSPQAEVHVSTPVPLRSVAHENPHSIEQDPEQPSAGFRFPSSQ